MIDPKITGARISRARQGRGMSREELSIQLGVAEQSVTTWERGLCLPPVESFPRLSKALGLSLEYLMEAEAISSAPAEYRYLYEGTSGDILGRLRIFPIVVELGAGIAPPLLNDFALQFAPKIVELRTRIPRETGVLIPGIRMMNEGGEAEPMRCGILFFGRLMWEKTYAGPVGFDALLGELERLIRENLALFVNRHMMMMLVEDLRASFPYSVEGVIPERISLTRLKRICKGLVEQGVPIRNLLALVEAVDDAVDEDGDDGDLIEAAKWALLQ